jgi:hypothetical protein
MSMHVSSAGWIRAVLLALLVLGIVSPGAAKLCGDDVAGQDVPCACGDTVASDVLLTDDPVLSVRCPSDGLIVRAPGAASGLTVDLAGRTLRGSGHGVGVWLVHGGPGGARLVSSGGPATIEGFRDGVVADGSQAAALIEGVVLRANTRDGLRLFDVDATEVRGAQALASGRDGFAVSGKRFRLTANRAVGSERHGYHIMGADGRLGTAGAGNVAESSGHRGFVIMGMGHHLVDCVAAGSGRDGVRLSGMHYRVNGCLAQHNGGDGIAGQGMDWQLAGNQALGNANNGITVSGGDVIDGGGNSGSGNHGQQQQRPAVQCAVNDVPCIP